MQVYSPTIDVSFHHIYHNTDILEFSIAAELLWHINLNCLCTCFFASLFDTLWRAISIEFPLICLNVAISAKGRILIAIFMSQACLSFTSSIFWISGRRHIQRNSSATIVVGLIRLSATCTSHIINTHTILYNDCRNTVYYKGQIMTVVRAIRLLRNVQRDKIIAKMTSHRHYCTTLCFASNDNCS
mgnify:CR=1 FL=1